MRFLRSHVWSGLAAAVLVALVPASSWATPFIFIGPRPNGMGGAGVAATDDAHAIYWNPAGLGMRPGFDVWISGSVRASVDTNLDNAVSELAA